MDTVDDLISDKEVGELWRHIGEIGFVGRLIRKIVAERAKYNRVCFLHELQDPQLANDWARVERSALQDFGIDEKDWK